MVSSPPCDPSGAKRYDPRRSRRWRVASDKSTEILICAVPNTGKRRLVHPRTFQGGEWPVSVWLLSSGEHKEPDVRSRWSDNDSQRSHSGRLAEEPIEGLELGAMVVFTTGRTTLSFCAPA